MNMYSKFYHDQRGVKDLKLGANKVSGKEEGIEDTSSRYILGEFQTLIKSDKSEFRNVLNSNAIPIPCSIRTQIFGMIEACIDNFFEAWK